MSVRGSFGALAIGVAMVAIGGCSSSTPGASPSPIPLAPSPGTGGPPTVTPDSPSPSTSGTGSGTSGAPKQVTIAFDGRIDVGDGRHVEARCDGVGTPTILIEGDFWKFDFIDRLAHSTTTCVYGRYDTGSASPAPGEPTMPTYTADVDTLLATLHREAGIEGPYVFVGWSFGGHLALANALTHPDDTAGLVILDTDFDTDFLAECRDSGRTDADCHGEYDGDPAYAIAAEVRAMLRPLPAVPLRLVTSLHLPDCDPARPDSLRAGIMGRTVEAQDCATLATKIADLQLKGWRTINPAVEQTRVETDHDVVAGATDQVVGIILDVVELARTTP